MASDELRLAIRRDAELMARGEELALRFRDFEPQFREALETGDIDAVATALDVETADLEALGRFFYLRAVELAERYPELSQRAQRWRDPEM